jgi:hypothetical protein
VAEFCGDVKESSQLERIKGEIFPELLAPLKGKLIPLCRNLSGWQGAAPHWCDIDILS